jgi:hypothetical protein
MAVSATSTQDVSKDERLIFITTFLPEEYNRKVKICLTTYPRYISLTQG